MTFLGEERWGVIGLGSSARKIPSRLPSESAFGLHLPRQTPDSSDLRRRLGSAELALAGSVPAGGGWDRSYALSGYGGGPNRCLVKVPGSTPGKIPNPSSNLGKMTKWVVRYEEDAYDPTAVWRIATAANHKADMVQQQRGGFQKVVTGLKESMNRVENLLQRLANLQDGGAINLRPIDESRNVSVLIQPREMARRVDDLRQINPNSTQGVQLKSTPEGNSKLLSTGLSVVAIGWDQDPLPCSRASSTVNHQNPSQEPALDRQWLQNPKENLSQSHPQYQAKQWDSNPSNKRDLSVSTVDDDLSYSNNMKIEQMEQTKVKAKLCSVEYQHRWVPGKEILEQEVYGIDPYTHNLPKETVPADLDWSIDDKAEEKKGVNESGDEDKINKDIAVKTNFVMANVPDEAKFYLTQLYMVGRDDRWLWSTGLLWKLPPWPDFCAMGGDSVAQHGGYEVLVNFHLVSLRVVTLRVQVFSTFCNGDFNPKSDSQFNPVAFYEAIKPLIEKGLLEEKLPDSLPHLRPYQLRAANGMVQCRKGNTMVSSPNQEYVHCAPYCVPIDFICKNSRMFYNPFNGNVSLQPEYSIVETEEKYICALCMELVVAAQTNICSHVTLIVCPAPILAQWHSEITRHTRPGSLKFCIYKGARIKQNVPYCTVGVISGLNRDIFSKAGVTIEDGAHFHMKQGPYNLQVQMLPISHHCYFIRLTLEYFKFSSLDADEPSACKYVILSKNVLAVFVVMNSTVDSSKEPGNIVFHTLTDAPNFYAMNLWFAEKARMEYLSLFGHSHFLFPERVKSITGP